MSEFESIPGQTPLEPRDLEGLIPGHIQTQAELNEFEAANIRRATEKYLTGRRGRADLYDPEGLKKIHQDMFDQTWKWAGQLRRRDINIGKGIHYIAPFQSAATAVGNKRPPTSRPGPRGLHRRSAEGRSRRLCGSDSTRAISLSSTEFQNRTP